jgi:hypothetical protein
MGEWPRRTTEFDPPVVPWETKIIDICIYVQIWEGEGRPVGGVLTELHG